MNGILYLSNVVRVGLSIFATVICTCRYAIIPSTDNWDGFLVRWGSQILPASQHQIPIQRLPNHSTCLLKTMDWNLKPWTPQEWIPNLEIIIWNRHVYHHYFYLQLEQISDNHEFGEDDRLFCKTLFMCENYNCVTQIHMPVVIFPQFFFSFLLDEVSSPTTKTQRKKWRHQKSPKAFVWMAKIWWAPFFFWFLSRTLRWVLTPESDPQEKQDRIRHYAEILVPVKVTGGITRIWVFPQTRGTPKWMVYKGKPY